MSRKMDFEFHKHLTTITSGGLLVYVAIIEKFQLVTKVDPVEHYQVLFLLGLSLLCSVLFMKLSTTADRNSFWLPKFGWVAVGAFIVAMMRMSWVLLHMGIENG